MSARTEIIRGLLAGVVIVWAISRSKKEPDSIFVKPLKPGYFDKCRGCQFYDFRQDDEERSLLIAAGISVLENKDISPCTEDRSTSYTVGLIMKQPGLWKIRGRLTQVCNSYAPYHR